MNEPDPYSRPDPSPDASGPWADRESGPRRMFLGTDKLRARDVLVALKTDRLEIRESVEKGRGIFATRAIKKSEDVFLSCGDERHSLFDVNEAVFGNPMSILVHRVLGENFETDTAVYMDGFTDNPLRYMNHSCEPNMGRFGNYLFVAMRNIGAGEELTADYSTLEGNPFWHMQCRCGVAHCRKKIGGVQTLTPDLFAQYEGYIPSFLRALYDEHIRSTTSHVRERLGF